MREFVDRLPEAILLISSSGIVQIANVKAAIILGRNKTELEGGCLSTMSLVAKSKVSENLKFCSRSTKPIPIGIPFVDPSGHELKLDITGFLFEEKKSDKEAIIMLRLAQSNTASSKFIALNKEIETQQKTMRLLVSSQNKLKKANKEINKYFNILNKYISSSTTDNEGNIVSVSQAFCEKSQYAEEELIGQNQNILLHPDNNETLLKKLWLTINAGNTWHGELKNVAKDGSPYYVDVFIEPEMDPLGNVSGFTSISQDITDKKRVEELSQRDALTKLYNRLKLDYVMGEEVIRASRFDLPVCFILLDIDHFKLINDEFGHLTGDKVLVELAKLLIMRVRDIDIVGRWGGEEFLIVCPGTQLKGAMKLSEDIRSVITNHTFSEVGHVSCSFGISEFVPKDSVESLLKRADDALYKAKDVGRDCVRALKD